MDKEEEAVSKKENKSNCYELMTSHWEWAISQYGCLSRRFCIPKPCLRPEAFRGRALWMLYFRQMVVQSRGKGKRIRFWLGVVATRMVIQSLSDLGFYGIHLL